MMQKTWIIIIVSILLITVISLFLWTNPEFTNNVCAKILECLAIPGVWSSILALGILALFSYACFSIYKQPNPSIWIKRVFGMGIVALLVFTGYVIFEQPISITEESVGAPERLKLILEALLVAVFGLIIAILQIAHSQQIANEQKTHNKDIANKQEKQAEKIANQQEYTSAVEHLSSASPAVRLKGVQDLYEHAKATDDKKVKKDIWKLLQDQAKYFTRGKNYQDEFKDSPSEDIQEIINVLTCREGYTESIIFDYSSGSAPVNLSGAYMIGADFSNAQLQGADFLGAYLQNSNFSIAKLQGANFWKARLQSADFLFSQLQGTHFREAQLQGARFWKARLQSAYFEGAKLQGARFWEAQLQGINFEGANLQGTHFLKTQLQGANFKNAQLQGANFGEAQLQGASFENAQLQGTYSTDIDTDSTDINTDDFKKVINKQADQSTDMSGTTIEGSLTKKIINEGEKYSNPKVGHWEEWCSQRMNELWEKLKVNHRGGVVYGSNKHFEDQDATLGEYTPKEADRWIKEYNKAMEWKNNVQ